MLAKPEETSEVARQATEPAKLVDYADALCNAESFQQALKMASFIAKSSFIPREFQNKPSDCLIALQMAASLGVSAFDVMNGIYVIHGRPAFSAKFAIALANKRGPFATRIHFESSGQGPSLEVTASAKLKVTGENASATISFKDAQTAGWTSKNDNYRAIPEQMLCYKAALMLIRRYCPEITMGMVSVDEAQELSPINKQNEAVEAITETLKEKP